MKGAGYIVVALFVFSASVRADCIDDAAKYHGVNACVLRAIGQTESGLNPKQRESKANKNGSKDHGAWQINDLWIPLFESYGVKRNELYDFCTSAYAGAYVLKDMIKRHGNTWRAVGAYNASTDSKRVIYVQKVQKNIELVCAETKNTNYSSNAAAKEQTKKLKMVSAATVMNEAKVEE